MVKRPFIRIFPPLIFIVIFLYGCDEAPSRRSVASSREVYALEVIDGDTIELAGGERVRYIGVDTPEIGEPFYDEAKRRNEALVLGRRLSMDICEEEPKDRYGRTLAWMYADGELVNAVLLREGMGRALIIPPCGSKRAAEFKDIERKARGSKTGVWGVQAGYGGHKLIPAGDAFRHIGEAVRVKVMAARVHKGRNAVFIGLEAGGAASFTAVIFRDGLREFERAGVDPVLYRGKTIALSGVIREYKGRPEIIIRGPSQIETAE